MPRVGSFVGSECFDAGKEAKAFTGTWVRDGWGEQNFPGDGGCR